MVGLFFVKEEERSKEGVTPIKELKQIESVGVLAKIVRAYASKFGASVIFAVVRRVRITGLAENSDGLFAVKIQELKEIPPAADQITYTNAYAMEIVSCLRELASHNSFYKEQLTLFLDQVDFSNPSDLADISPLLTTPDANKLQDILATARVDERLHKTLELLKVELETMRIQTKIQKNLDEKVSATQRKFYLNEQLKMIKKELGLEHDEKDTLLQKFNERIADKVLSEEADKAIKEELGKLQTLEPSSSEYNVCRNYLDWLTVLPWGVQKEEKYDLQDAKQVLDEDHFGLVKLKERILEFIAVGKLRGSVVGKIICLVGPPGTGKTSIGKSVARALGREFFRFSVGGMSDVAEIKGHRRTYIGAMPGKLIQVMKQSKSANPVIMIDEIDKLGKGHGDPASALLEVLDPEQNTSFLDHYLDVPFDLSKVLFICTSNTLDTIPRPLLDRMEVLRLSGYILEEKFAICKKYLIPKMFTESGIKEGQVKIHDDTLPKLIQEYCREAGVRNLQQQVEKLFRKAAYKIALNEKTPIHVTTKNLEDFLGKPRFTHDRYFVSSPAGVALGMAWTEMGGSLIYLETAIEKTPSKEENGGSLHITGKLGEVMKESSAIAFTYAKRMLKKIDPNNDFLEKNSIHMHAPEGATPKDGPSAGITMVTALLSLALDKPIKHNLAMTGELTLTGKVLEIGGVKEKTIGAKRGYITDIILPIDNKKDWDELDEEIKRGINVHFVDYYKDVYDIAFNYDATVNAKAIKTDEKRVEKQEKETLKLAEEKAKRKKQVRRAKKE